MATPRAWSLWGPQKPHPCGDPQSLLLGLSGPPEPHPYRELSSLILMGTPRTPSLWHHRDIQSFVLVETPLSLILRGPSEPGPCGPVGTPIDWCLSEPPELDPPSLWDYRDSQSLVPMGTPKPCPYGSPPVQQRVCEPRPWRRTLGHARPRGHQPGTEPLGPPITAWDRQWVPTGCPPCGGGHRTPHPGAGGTFPTCCQLGATAGTRTQGHGDGATSAPGAQTPTFTL